MTPFNGATLDTDCSMNETSLIPFNYAEQCIIIAYYCILLAHIMNILLLHT